MSKIELRKDFLVNDVKFKTFVNIDDETIEKVRSWRNNESVRKWMYCNHIISQEEHQSFIKTLKQDNCNFSWVGELGTVGLEIGVVCLNNVSFQNKKADLGIYINPVEAIPGAGRKLMQGLVKIAFEYAGLEKLELEVLCENEKGIKFYEKLGFKENSRKIKVLANKHEEIKVVAMNISKGMVKI